MSSPPPRSTGLVAHERYFWHDTGSGAGTNLNIPLPP
jgi:hypothetical protein